MRSPDMAEKELRTLLRSRSLKLSALVLPDAFEAMMSFYQSCRDFDVLAPEGDGLVAYEDVTNHERGTRLEIGFTRLFRLFPGSEEDSRWPALRLRLRLCYKWDMDVIKLVLPAQTWSMSCWSIDELEPFRESVLRTTGYTVMKDKKPAETNISLEETTYRRNQYRSTPEVKQMWWGVQDVS